MEVVRESMGKSERVRESDGESFGTLYGSMYRALWGCVNSSYLAVPRASDERSK